MLTKKTLIPFLFTILILSACSSLLTTRRAGATISGYPVVSITPTVSFAAVGENVNVSIVISNGVSLFLYQVYVSYSSELVSIVNVTEGSLLGRGGAYPTFWRAVYNNDQGLLQVANSLFRGGQTVMGDGEAFIVTLKMNKPGGSQLLLHDILLKNEFAITFTPVFTQNATISTAAIGVTPNPIRPNASNDYSINKTFNVNITLNGAVSKLYMYDLNVTYGKDVLEATAADLLPFMGIPNTNLTTIDNDDGKVRLSLECTPPAASTNVTGALAIITFRVISLGATDIEISENSALMDEDGKGIFPILGSASFNNQYANRNIGVVSSALSSYEVTAGDDVTETTVVRNDGSTNLTYQIAVHAYDTQDNIPALVAGPSTLTIGKNTTATITMTLKTTGLDGNYTVQAYIYNLPEETSYQDNTYTITMELLVHPAAEESPSPFGTTFYAIVAAIVILVAIIAAYILLRRKKAS